MCELCEKNCVEKAVVQIKSFPIRDGDTLHVKVGLDSVAMGGQPPWIPGTAELEAIRAEIEEFVPEGANVYVTHLGIEMDAVVRDER